LDVLPFTPVSSTCTSGMGDLSSAEQQDVKPKRCRTCQVATKQPNPGPLELNQTKRAKIHKLKQVSFFKNKIFLIA